MSAVGRLRSPEPSPAGKAATAPAIAGDHELRPRQQEVGSANDTVNRGLARTVAVIEHVLGIGIVHGNDRVAQHPFLGHSTQSDDTGRGLFCPADYVIQGVLALAVQHAHQVGAVVHRDLRPVIDGRHNVLIVGLVVFAFDGKHRDRIIAHEAGRDIVLGGQRVGRT